MPRLRRLYRPHKAAAVSATAILPIVGIAWNIPTSIASRPIIVSTGVTTAIIIMIRNPKGPLQPRPAEESRLPAAAARDIPAHRRPAPCHPALPPEAIAAETHRIPDTPDHRGEARAPRPHPAVRLSPGVQRGQAVPLEEALPEEALMTAAAEGVPISSAYRALAISKMTVFSLVLPIAIC